MRVGIGVFGWERAEEKPAQSFLPTILSCPSVFEYAFATGRGPRDHRRPQEEAQ